MVGMSDVPVGGRHLALLRAPLDALEADVGRITGWGDHLALVLLGGGRLLACGNGGSAAQAQHLTSELVGRYRHERQPFSAIALHAETSTVTAIANDYPPDLLFARQVQAHGRPGDVFVALSTSGRSPNVVAALRTARQAGLTTWVLTGPAPNALSVEADDAVVVTLRTRPRSRRSTRWSCTCCAPPSTPPRPGPRWRWCTHDPGDRGR
jgi:D-sedoheptulose 7-phosphate isomerase